MRDSLKVMDGHVNDHLRQIIQNWQGPRDDVDFAWQVYHRLGGWYWVDEMEHWATKSPEVDRYPQRKYRSIYRGMPIWATRVNYLFGVGSVSRVNGVRVGSDKFGHFFSQGLKYYLRQQRGWDLPHIFKQGAFAERWIFGQWTTGVFSNADLVANYEGFLFYQNLLQDDVEFDRKALIGWRGEQPFLQRSFSWQDYVNDYWDEALNPSFLSKSLQKHMATAISRLCDQYRARPEEYTSAADEDLWQRYMVLGLKDARYNRFDHICAPLIAH